MNLSKIQPMTDWSKNQLHGLLELWLITSAGISELWQEHKYYGPPRAIIAAGLVLVLVVASLSVFLILAAIGAIGDAILSSIGLLTVIVLKGQNPSDRRSF